MIGETRYVVFQRLETEMIGNKRGERSAFTLVELMTVVAIIAVLIGLVVGVAGYASRKAAVSRAQADLEKIRAAVEEHRAIYGEVPRVVCVQNNQSTGLTYHLWVKPQAGGRPPLLVMKGWSDTNIAYPLIDPWGNDYCYSNRTAYRYELWSKGPDSLSPADDIVSGQPE